MRYALTHEQRSVQALARDLVRGHFGSARAREIMAAEVWPGVEGTAHRAICDAGLNSLLIPESIGGAGAGYVEACLVAEEFARGLATMPYSGSSIIASTALLAAGRDDQLQAMAAGHHYSVVLDENVQRPANGPTGLLWDWMPGSVPITVDGADVVASAPNPEVGRSEDLLRPLARVSLETVAMRETQSPTAVHAAAWIAAAAELTGLMAAALDQAVEHAKTREQFGVPIGSFQAIQHRLADMYTQVEASRALLYGCAWQMDHAGPAAAVTAAAMAKSAASDTAPVVVESAFQVFGGMGFTWESDIHLLLRRVHRLAMAFGDGRAAARAVGMSLLSAEGGED